MSRRIERGAQRILRAADGVELTGDQLRRATRIRTPRLWPLLEYVEQAGWVTARWVDGPPPHGRGRVYQTTQQGRAQITPPELAIRRRQFLPNTWLPGWMVDPHRRCPHVNQRGIYGDEIIAMNYKARARCLDCGRLLDNPPGRTT